MGHLWIFDLDRIYPLENKHNYGKSPVLMGESTINGHF